MRPKGDGFLNLVSVDAAACALLRALPGGDRPTEVVEAAAAVGRVLSGDLVAAEDLPGFERSQMDGYAVRASDTHGASEGLPAYLELVGEVLMGRPPTVEVGAGQAARISTGGVLPEGADAVVMVEDTELSGSTVEVVRAVAPGENVILSDEDIHGGSVVLRRGQAIGAAQAGVLAALGVTDIEVYALPIVGIISTGDELVPPGVRPGPGQVRDVNTAALSAAVVRSGCVPRVYGIVADDEGELSVACRSALPECDGLIISGGSSVGVRDVTVDVMSELGGPGVLAHGLYLRPGKPSIVAVCDGRPVFGLPGNPASALVVFREVIAPVLKRLRGEEQAGPWAGPRLVSAFIDRSVASATGRLELVPVELSQEGGAIVATPVRGKSSLIGTLARAHGNVRIPEGSEGVMKGQQVTVELFDL